MTTYVLAGVNHQRYKLIATIPDVTAWMASFEIVEKARAWHTNLERDLGIPGRPLRYLDSGVFTLIRRAGLASQPRDVKQDEGFRRPITHADLVEHTARFVTYLRKFGHLWDHIVELDYDEFGADGVAITDHLRPKLRALVGDRLLPVWHAQRGVDGLEAMCAEYQYICLSPTKASRGLSFKQMTDLCHARGTRVHLLGVSTDDDIATGCDSLDSSAWLSAERWGFVRWGDARINFGRMYASKYVGKVDILRRFAASHGINLDDVMHSKEVRMRLGALAMLHRIETVDTEALAQ